MRLPFLYCYPVTAAENGLKYMINTNNINEDPEKRIYVPIWEKANLTLPEAAALYNIGINRLRELSDDDHCPFVLFVGNKRLIKRKQFEQYIENAFSI